MEISVRLGLRLTAKSAGLLYGVYRRAVVNFSVTQIDIESPEPTCGDRGATPFHPTIRNP
jgi:hypothetical protein